MKWYGEIIRYFEIFRIFLFRLKDERSRVIRICPKRKLASQSNVIKCNQYQKRRRKLSIYTLIVCACTLAWRKGIQFFRNSLFFLHFSYVVKLNTLEFFFMQYLEQFPIPCIHNWIIILESQECKITLDIYL